MLLALTTELLECAAKTANSTQKKQQQLNIPQLCQELAQEIIDRTYQPNVYTRFAVTEPKLREIYAPDFKDRLAQCWLVKYAEPLIERHLIDDTYSNRINKGPLKAISKVQKLMRQPNNQYCLQLDVAAFFNSIHRPTLLKNWLTYLAKFQFNYKPEIIYLSEQLLNQSVAQSPHVLSGSRELLQLIPKHKQLQCAPKDTGLPIGSISSQIFANFYLSELDHFVKHQLKVKSYCRYMDDFVLLADSSQQLITWQKMIKSFLFSELKLMLHPTKQHLQKSSQGINYLGFRVYPHHKHILKRNLTKLICYLRFFNQLICGQPTSKWLPERRYWLRAVKQFAFYQQSQTKITIAFLYPYLLQMQATLNSYFGLLQQANQYQLRKLIYHDYFAELKHYFLPNNGGYFSVRIKKWVTFELK